MADNGIQPKAPYLGLPPVEGGANQQQPVAPDIWMPWYTPQNDPNDSFMAGMDAKSQFLISQGLQTRHLPVTPHTTVSYAQSKQRVAF